MLIKEERNIKKEFVKEVICNICGKSICPDNEDFIHIDKQWGYFSNKDGKNQEADFCEDCWDNLCDKFKIKV